MTVASETREITLNDKGTDLVFEISPMSATKAEAWLAKAISALAPGLCSSMSDSGLDIQSLTSDHGRLLAGLSQADPDLVVGLTDQLYECAKRKLSDGVLQKVSKETIDGYVRSPATLVKLKTEILKVNFDFFGLGSLFGSP